MLADFSLTESSTISYLFNTYCMSMYSRNLCRLNNGRNLIPLYTAWRKSIRHVWRLDRKTHNNVLHYINNCLPIEIIFERRCIKFIHNIISSEHSLHSRISLYSLYNCNIVLGENILLHYFMYQYNMSHRSLYNVNKFIYSSVSKYGNTLTIRYVCIDRDSGKIEH